MIVNIYAYRDVQVGAFQKPFYDTNEKEVVCITIGRTVAMMSEEDAQKAHVKDLELYSLGTLNDETGVIVSCPEFLLRLADYVKEVPVNDKSISNQSKETA